MIMKQCRLSPSPLVGRILRELEELQAAGEIATAQEAVARAVVLAQQWG
jgi:hypothetical protein